MPMGQAHVGVRPQGGHTHAHIKQDCPPSANGMEGNDHRHARAPWSEQCGSLAEEVTSLEVDNHTQDLSVTPSTVSAHSNEPCVASNTSSPSRDLDAHRLQEESYMSSTSTSHHAEQVEVGERDPRRPNEEDLFNAAPAVARPRVKLYRARANFGANFEDTCIGFLENDIIEVSEEEEPDERGWIYAKHQVSGVEGYAPINRLEIVPP